jgi:cytochrome c oxidase subunit 3
MDLTQGTLEEKNNRAKKMMLWFGIISLTMSFAGLTSAVLVSSKRADWLTNITIPSAFSTSTLLIVLSSVTILLSKVFLKKSKLKQSLIMLIATLILGVGFLVSQFNGFGQIIDQGYYLTGPSSNVTMSYLYVIAFWHILHVIVGLIVLLVVIYNHFKQKYNTNKMIGLELSATYWHFVDILWLLLFLFFNFFT